MQIEKREKDWKRLSTLKELLGDDHTREDKADGSQSDLLDQNLVRGH